MPRRLDLSGAASPAVGPTAAGAVEQDVPPVRRTSRHGAAVKAAAAAAASAAAAAESAGDHSPAGHDDAGGGADAELDSSQEETKANSRESSPTTSPTAAAAAASRRRLVLLQQAHDRPATAAAAAAAEATAETMAAAAAAEATAETAAAAAAAATDDAEASTAAAMRVQREMEELRQQIAAVDQDIEEADNELRGVLWDYIPKFRCKNISGARRAEVVEHKQYDKYSFGVFIGRGKFGEVLKCYGPTVPSAAATAGAAGTAAVDRSAHAGVGASDGGGGGGGRGKRHQQQAHAPGAAAAPSAGTSGGGRLENPDKAHGQPVAIKVVHAREALTLNSVLQFESEIQCLKMLSHRNVLTLVDVFRTETRFFFVTEFIDGGNLYAYLQRLHPKVPPMEADNDDCGWAATARNLMRQATEGLHYCHRRSICHRDLKPENILVQRSRGSGGGGGGGRGGGSNGGGVSGGLHVLLADFGFAQKVMPGVLLKQYCGTVGYMAPEVINDKGYDGLVADIFSLGATFLDCLRGVEEGWLRGVSAKEDRTRAVIDRVLDEHAAYFDDLSCDLLRQTLEFDASRRVSTKKILQHPWFAQGPAAASASSSSSSSSSSSLASSRASLSSAAAATAAPAAAAAAATAAPAAAAPAATAAPAAAAPAAASTGMVGNSSGPGTATKTAIGAAHTIATDQHSASSSSASPAAEATAAAPEQRGPKAHAGGGGSTAAATGTVSASRRLHRRNPVLS